MTYQVDRFQAALTALVKHGHIKQRLIAAYENNLADIHDDELPVALQQPFADLRRQMVSVTPLNGEGSTCASVRKMSFDEASECAATIVALFADIVRLDDISKRNLPHADVDEHRIPPFLVKSN